MAPQVYPCDAFESLKFLPSPEICIRDLQRLARCDPGACAGDSVASIPTRPWTSIIEMLKILELSPPSTHIRVERPTDANTFNAERSFQLLRYYGALVPPTEARRHWEFVSERADMRIATARTSRECDIKTRV